MSRMLTLMPDSSPKLTKLICFCRCLPLLCYTLVLSPLLLGVGHKLNLVLFWGCSKLISRALICFIGPYKPSKMKSNRLFAYLLTKLLEIQWTNQHGSFSSYCHIGVCIIFKEVVQISERFLPTLGSFWRAFNLLFKRSPPIFHWTIIRPLVFIDVSHWAKLDNRILLL